jgi:hypothetical protein
MQIVETRIAGADQGAIDFTQHIGMPMPMPMSAAARRLNGIDIA